MPNTNTTKAALGESLKKLVLRKRLKKALEGKKTYETWQEGMSQVFEAVLENKAFILNVYRSIGREKVEGYLYKFTYDMLKEVVEDRCRDVELSAAHKGFIADFYKYGFVGIMLDWIGHGMKEDNEEIVENMGVMLHGNLARSIENFGKADAVGLFGLHNVLRDCFY